MGLGVKMGGHGGRINWKGANGGQHYTGPWVKREKRVREGKQRGHG